MNSNVKNVLLITGILLLLITVLSLTASAADYTKTIGEDNINEDGYVNGNRHLAEITQWVHQTSAARLYTEWNISEIPDEAEIEYLEFHWQTLQSGWCGLASFTFYDIYNQPTKVPYTPAGASNIYSDCGNGSWYYTNIGGTFPDVPGVHSLTLTDADNSICTDFEDALTKDWWALGVTAAGGCGAWTTIGEIASSEHPTSPPWYFVVGYNLTAPQINTSLTTPSDGSTGVNTSTQICVNITHDDGVTMNITWYWLNSTDDFVLFHTDTNVPNGTYCTNYTNATKPCTEYWWYVHVEDPEGNYTEEVFSFTTFCVDPPTYPVCTRINDTAFNLSFTPLPAHNGTSWTIVRYQPGYEPPGFAEGTLAGNTSGNYTVINNLKEATCYAFSLWTDWNSSNGTWYLSGSKSTKICCTTGGNYRVCLFYEDRSQEAINLSHYPFGTHRLKAFLVDGTEVVRYLNASWYENNSNCSCINLSLDAYPLYFELWWNYSHVGNQSTCSYKRKLLPDAIQNWSECGCKGSTIKFYLITDRHVYNEYYYNYSGAAILELDIEDNLVQYAYQFDDRTQLFDTTSPNDAYASFYCYNETAKLIIHQEYWDAAKKVYPVLIHHKHYFTGVNTSSSDTDEFDNIGLTPTEDRVEETIIINPVTEYIATLTATLDLSFGWQIGATGLWVQYKDLGLSTNTVNCTITDTYTDTQVYTYEVTFNEYNFTFNAANQSRTYYILLTIDHQNWTNDITLELFLSPSTSILSTTAQIDAVFQNLFGLAPFYNPESGETMSWSYMLMLSACMVSFLAFIESNPPLAILSPGLCMIVLTIVISGFPLAWVGVGAFLVVIAIVYSIAGGKKE